MLPECGAPGVEMGSTPLFHRLRGETFELISASLKLTVLAENRD
jgi:hypothetical protein